MRQTIYLRQPAEGFLNQIGYQFVNEPLQTVVSFAPHGVLLTDVGYICALFAGSTYVLSGPVNSFWAIFKPSSQERRIFLPEIRPLPSESSCQ